MGIMFKCSECGCKSLTYIGRCPRCGAFGTMEESDDTGLPRTGAPQTGLSRAGASRTGLARTGHTRTGAASPIAALEAEEQEKLPSGIDELDRVLGGGWVRGGVVLLGGEPGVGKSTLLLQVCAAMARRGKRVLYISGEESSGQLALRGRRLGLMTEGLDLLCDSSLGASLAAAEKYKYDFMVIDSVQSFRAVDESGWAGSPTQVKCTAALAVDTAKRCAIPTVIVGHITKQGQIAGPKLLEHMVDVVLLFSGEQNSPNRLLRAEKNRFGSTDELGIFEMTGNGLKAVDDASSLYWNISDMGTVSGVSIAMVLEGSRALAAEVQALACHTPFPYPKRTARGIDTNRLQLLLAVLEKRCGIYSRTEDIYLNVAGGLNMKDPSADLAACAALAGALKDIPLPSDVCFIGEVGLAGEVRPAGRMLLRLKEAARLGFKRAVISRRTAKETFPMETLKISSIRDIVDLFLK